jgi:hypothetical protein
MHGRKPGVDLDLCDVCYWRVRAERYEAIESDNELVIAIDRMKFRLKGYSNRTQLQRSFNSVLNDFIKQHGLDGDPHHFAALPMGDKL